MDREVASREKRDAVLLPLLGGKRGQIVYNPVRPPGRVGFSIAHEIAHTFFPNSISGARFRTMCNPDSREGNELERLCDLAASELLMPLEEFRSATGQGMGLHMTEQLSDIFGSSFESTVFRMATSYQGLAAAGLLRYRLKTGEQRARLVSRNLGCCSSCPRRSRLSPCLRNTEGSPSTTRNRAETNMSFRGTSLSTYYLAPILLGAALPFNAHSKRCQTK